MVSLPSRLQAILKELESDAVHYVDAKSEFDIARVHFEVARDRLAATKKNAVEIMDWEQWFTWRRSHASVRFAASPIGEAIQELLRDYAYDRAIAYVRGDVEVYSPFRGLSQITDELEQGGFDFRTSTPRREVNGALINLDVLKFTGLYAASDKNEFLAIARTSIDASEQRTGDSPEQMQQWADEASEGLPIG